MGSIRAAPPHGFVSEGPWTYLITGATGFLGRHILQSLRRITPDSRVVIVVRDRSSWENQSWRAEAGEVQVMTGSLLDISGWKNDPLLARVDGIFHLAAVVKHTRASPEEMVRINVDATLNMVRLAAEKKCRLVFASSSGTVGCSRERGPAPNEDAPYCDEVVGKWPYYASKIYQERLAFEPGVKAFPRALALAEVNWSPVTGRSFDAFVHRLNGQYPFLDRLKVNYRKPDAETTRRAP